VSGTYEEVTMDLITLATHTEHWHDGHWWGIFIPFLWFFLIVGTIYFFSRRARRHGGCGGHRRDSGESVLAERYARGEINENEYRERQRVLRQKIDPAG
jgi:putative membrane protein